ncbi:hypothetical protein HYC85_008778 [Camellia sinensis]|uniref:Uncharacterized protein n=1 Tax=Camellia sinensis TaxID=4442 RepID=A0A7J7HSU3_CAMSI|nr:hypothetical protein HYC85_008778 [Camellia sinensis]
MGDFLFEIRNTAGVRVRWVVLTFFDNTKQGWVREPNRLKTKGLNGSMETRIEIEENGTVIRVDSRKVKNFSIRVQKVLIMVAKGTVKTLSEDATKLSKVRPSETRSRKPQVHQATVIYATFEFLGTTRINSTPTKFICI